LCAYIHAFEDCIGTHNNNNNNNNNNSNNNNNINNNNNKRNTNKTTSSLIEWVHGRSFCVGEMEHILKT